MPLTAADLERRKSYLTASDVPAVLGLSPFRTPLQVWADKTGQSEPWEGNEATTFGDDFEGALIDRAARLVGLTNVRRNQFVISPGGLLAATCDAIADFERQHENPRGERLASSSPEPVGIEAKTSGIINPGADLDAWGDSGTCAVPDHVAIQMQVQMLSGNLRHNFCSALLGRGKGHRLYPLTRDDESLKWIEDFCQTWWAKHVKGGTPPPASKPADNTVVRFLKRDDAKTVPIDGMLVANCESLWQIADEAKARAEVADAALKLALGDAGIGTYPTGIVEYLEEGAGDKFDRKGLKAAHPEIYAQFATKATRRVLRVKANK